MERVFAPLAAAMAAILRDATALAAGDIGDPPARQVREGTIGPPGCRPAISHPGTPTPPSSPPFRCVRRAQLARLDESSGADPDTLTPPGPRRPCLPGHWGPIHLRGHRGGPARQQHRRAAAPAAPLGAPVTTITVVASITVVVVCGPRHPPRGQRRAVGRPAGARPLPAPTAAAGHPRPPTVREPRPGGQPGGA